MSDKKYVYPDKLEIKPLTRPVNATIRVPGSKSITNRALVLAALSSQRGECRLEGALFSDDTDVMIKSLRRLGYDTSADGLETIVIGHNRGPRVPRTSAEIFAGESGTTMRFVTALVSVGNGRYRIDCSPRMRERPMVELIRALRLLGVQITSEMSDDRPPFIVETAGLKGGRVRVRGDVSSQFLSAILMIAPFANDEIEICVEGDLVSQPYVEMTIGQMSDYGLKVQQPSADRFVVQPQTPAQNDVYFIEADASAGSYFFAAAAILNVRVVVDGYIPKDISIQGDLEFLTVLEQMGCSIERDLIWNIVDGGPLRGIDIDMNAISDTVMTLAAVACFAKGPTTIRNVAHIRHKECDRISALCTELRKLGVEVEEYPDGLKITPRPMHGAEIETYNDHRMAMSMALIGLRVPGVVIKNPGCVAKTYPGYWEDFQKLYG